MSAPLQPYLSRTYLLGLARLARSLPHLFAERPELLCIRPSPYPLHVLPIRDDTVFHRVLDLEQTSQLLGSPSNEEVPLYGSRHTPDMLGPAYEGGEVAGGQRRAGESSLESSGPLSKRTR